MENSPIDNQLKLQIDQNANLDQWGDSLQVDDLKRRQSTLVLMKPSFQLQQIQRKATMIEPKNLHAFGFQKDEKLLDDIGSPKQKDWK